MSCTSSQQPEDKVAVGPQHCTSSKLTDVEYFLKKVNLQREWRGSPVIFFSLMAEVAVGVDEVEKRAHYELDVSYNQYKAR